MKIALPLLAFSTIVAVSGFGTPAHAGPSGPSARMAARLKKYPTSRWLAHYLPDDRYKIAGGVWKYVSTDLDTYYHRPESALMMNQPAGRVIGFSSAAEAEEAGYRPGPSVPQQSQSLESNGAIGASRSNSNPELRRVLSALRELQTISNQMQNDKSRNLPLAKQRLQRVIMLIDALPVKPREARAMNSLKSGLRGLVTAIDLKTQGNDAAARQQLALALTVLQGASRQSQQLGSSRRR
ncbi:hypothetical protein B1R32_10290 [Abditibacterium utsteinense]|uniref:Uncharacterized protein n=1 Tax=Abditibacterium utsteinense TaxID=1960156 RepID=A0A2S8SWB4_9BACT|nr:hypothetical protein [Abditibacterium utsteinense]PQV65083.1 hypothetical protein B1R32_10290 [Abditibacterium utsteinense]